MIIFATAIMTGIGGSLIHRMHLHGTSHHTAFDSALIAASQDAEGSLLTPRVIPAVDTGPVWHTALLTPPDHLDGVTTEVLAGDVLVDAGGVGFKVFVDREGNRESSLFHELLLHVADPLDRVAAGGFVLNKR